MKTARSFADSLWWLTLLPAVTLISGGRSEGAPIPSLDNDREQARAIVVILRETFEGLDVSQVLGGGQVIEGKRGSLEITITTVTFNSYSPDGQLIIDGELILRVLPPPITAKGELMLTGSQEGRMEIDLTVDISAEEPALGGTATFKGNEYEIAELLAESTAVETASGGRIEADFDGNGKIDFGDFFLFADAFGGTDSKYDLNGNGAVDFDDFFIFADHFGQDVRAKMMALAGEYIGLPASPRLEQNYPNPFNGSTTIRYQISESGWVQLDVFDQTGQRIRTLVSDFQKPGSYETSWNGTDAQGEKVSTGIYLMRLQSGNFADVGKVMLIK